MQSGEILTGLASIANDWRWLAITWHIVLAALLVMLLAGWRPTTRLLSHLLVAPLVSVSVIAWVSGNPFNGTTFAVLAAVLVWAATRLSDQSVHLAPRVWVAQGVALLIFGWIYPHFLRTDSWTPYLYASPLGLLPCPTLSAVIGMTLLQNLRSRLWNMALVVASLLYGAVGVFQLGVVLDWALLFASAALAVLVLYGNGVWRSVRADLAERTRPLPGDNVILEPLATLTHAITIARVPQQVWPWLIQMGAGNRAGWYSYDVVDNGRRPSATRLMPDLQNITIGTVFPALPGETEGFKVLDFDRYRSLILVWPIAGDEPIVTWAFVLDEKADGSTRLIVRARGGQSYRFHGLPSSLSKPIVRFVHFIMERKQLLGIARRVEMMPAGRANGLLDVTREMAEQKVEAHA